jgi:hypothetical protein
MEDFEEGDEIDCEAGKSGFNTAGGDNEKPIS